MTMKAMLVQGLRVLLVTMGCLLMVASADAQEKHKIFWKTQPGSVQYTQRHVLDVGDVPGHQVVLFEVHFDGKDTDVAYDGVKVVEAWQRGQSDLVNGTGRSWSYLVSLLENGDKVFSRLETMVQTTIPVFTVSTLTGGTGKFKGLRGSLRTTGFTNLKTGLSTEAVWEGEYWIEN